MQNVGAGLQGSVWGRLPPPPLQSAPGFARWVGRRVLSRVLGLWGCERSGEQTPPPLGKTSSGRRIPGRNTLTPGPQHSPVSQLRRRGWDAYLRCRGQVETGPDSFARPGGHRAAAPALSLPRAEARPSRSGENLTFNHLPSPLNEATTPVKGQHPPMVTPTCTDSN